MNYGKTQIADFKKASNWQTGSQRREAKRTKWIASVITKEIDERNCTKCSHSFPDYSNNLICGIRIVDGENTFHADFKTGKTAVCDKYTQTGEISMGLSCHKCGSTVDLIITDFGDWRSGDESMWQRTCKSCIDADIDCNHCGNSFVVSRNVEVTYTTAKTD
jgi:hypothetical protein